MIFLGLYVIAVLVGVYGLVDAAVRPWDHWQRAGANKTNWVYGQLLVLVPIAGLVGLAVALFYLIEVRPKLLAAATERTP